VHHRSSRYSPFSLQINQSHGKICNFAQISACQTKTTAACQQHLHLNSGYLKAVVEDSHKKFNIRYKAWTSIQPNIHRETRICQVKGT